MKRAPLVIVLLTVLLDLIGFGIVLPLLPTYAKDLGANPAMIGLIAAIFSIMQFIFSPLWGKLSDKIGRRPVMLISIFVTAVSYLVLSQASTIPLLIFARGLSGIGSANIATAQAYITDVTDSKNRSGAMGMIGAAFGIGFIIGPLIGGVLKHYYGIPMVGYVSAALISLDFILAIFLLPESNRNAQKMVFGFLKKRTSESAPRRSVSLFLGEKATEYVDGLKLTFSSRPLALLMIANYIYTFAIVNMQVASILLWKEYFRATDEQIGYIFAYVGVWSVIVQGGLIRKLIKKLGEHKLFLWGHFFTFIGVFFVPFAPQSSLFSIGLVILFFFAIGTSLVAPINLSMISLYSYKQQQGQILGLSQSVNSFARIMGPFSGSILYGMNFHAPYIVAGILTLAGAIIALSLFKYKIEALDPSTEANNG
ncbi:MFS transporter [Pelodictyon phaeoclathratiforme]|jgi:multidrug resistance protein|uniref:Major facilitator superfamily MFS_1 n=1 Tax=Pelodictyon phaeoclathratiforme (strain DSM 5477 / BU-1) TaxID=324925 RepID=B4SGS4_PELPB|nr:major facilitator superfamily MFS_1 [Pelodictyon phaeoclathratiforme BU-1]MBV5290201.1 tetracycline resistance MFS efflux pump [Pelodictyon phaeoclathratiforme]